MQSIIQSFIAADIISGLEKSALGTDFQELRGRPSAAKKRVKVAEDMIWTPEPTCTQSDMASLGVRKTSPLTIFHPLSSKSSFGPAEK